MMLYARKIQVATVALLAASMGTAVAAPFTIVVNGRAVDTGGVAPAVINNHLLVPLAAIGTAMGAYLEWRPASRSVYGRENMNEFVLPINSGTATVNGQSRALEAPAAIVQGRTMVPLRFVAEALGADVRFDGATRTVTITGGGGTPTTPTTPTTPATALNIDRFFVSPSGPVRAGQTFTVTLEGTPGVRAEFDYGAQRHAALPEVSPGRYVKQVQVPANAAFGRAVVTGRILAGNQSREVQAGERLVIDTQAPTIGSLSPANAATVNTNQPYITAEFDDHGQTGVDEASVKILVNDQDVTSQANVSSDRVVFRNALPTGANRVHVEAADLAGNKAAADWRFTVSGQQTTEAPPAPIITEPAADTPVSGEIRVRGTAQPGATVRVRTTYKGTVLVVFSQQGEVNSQEVTAAANGKWETAPFTLKAPSGVSNPEYTVTATAVNSQGLTSEPTQLTIPRR